MAQDFKELIETNALFPPPLRKNNKAINPTPEPFVNEEEPTIPPKVPDTDVLFEAMDRAQAAYDTQLALIKTLEWAMEQSNVPVKRATLNHIVTTQRALLANFLQAHQDAMAAVQRALTSDN